MNKNDVVKVYLDKTRKNFDFFLKKEKEYMEHPKGYFIKDVLIRGIDGNIYFKDEYNEVEVEKKHEEHRKKLDNEKKKMIEEMKSSSWSTLDDSAKTTWAKMMGSKKRS